MGREETKGTGFFVPKYPVADLGGRQGPQRSSHSFTSGTTNSLRGVNPFSRQSLPSTAAGSNKSSVATAPAGCSSPVRPAADTSSLEPAGPAFGRQAGSKSPPAVSDSTAAAQAAALSSSLGHHQFHRNSNSSSSSYGTGASNSSQKLRRSWSSANTVSASAAVSGAATTENGTVFLPHDSSAVTSAGFSACFAQQLDCAEVAAATATAAATAAMLSSSISRGSSLHTSSNNLAAAGAGPATDMCAAHIWQPLDEVASVSAAAAHSLDAGTTAGMVSAVSAGWPHTGLESMVDALAASFHSTADWCPQPPGALLEQQFQLAAPSITYRSAPVPIPEDKSGPLAAAAAAANSLLARNSPDHAASFVPGTASTAHSLLGNSVDCLLLAGTLGDSVSLLQQGSSLSAAGAGAAAAAAAASAGVPAPAAVARKNEAFQRTAFRSSTLWFEGNQMQQQEQQPWCQQPAAATAAAAILCRSGSSSISTSVAPSSQPGVGADAANPTATMQLIDRELEQLLAIRQQLLSMRGSGAGAGAAVGAGAGATRSLSDLTLPGTTCSTSSVPPPATLRALSDACVHSTPLLQNASGGCVSSSTPLQLAQQQQLLDHNSLPAAAQQKLQQLLLMQQMQSQLQAELMHLLPLA